MRPREKNNLTVLGIDPGSLSCGYGIIKKEGQKLSYIASGRIAMPHQNPLHARLKRLHDGLISVIRQYRPDGAAVEKIFFAKGIKSALSLGHARGVALLAVAGEGISLYEYSALEVKKAVTGYGKAEKRQVQQMIKAVLGTVHEPVTEDASDALALALCHINRASFDAIVRDDRHT